MPDPRRLAALAVDALDQCAVDLADIARDRAELTADIYRASTAAELAELRLCRDLVDAREALVVTTEAAARSLLIEARHMEREEAVTRAAGRSAARHGAVVVGLPVARTRLLTAEDRLPDSALLLQPRPEGWM